MGVSLCLYSFLGFAVRRMPLSVRHSLRGVRQQYTDSPLLYCYTYNTGRRVDSTDYARACLDNDTPNVSVYKHGRYSSCQLMRRLCDRIADEAGKKRESVVESSLFPSLIFLAPRRLLYISLYILCYMCVSGLFVLVFDS